MPLPLSGTVAVTNGSAEFAWTGTPLHRLNCVPGATMVIDGATYFVGAEPTDTSHGILTRPYAAANNAAAPAEISQLSADQVATATLNKRAADVYSQLSVLDANGRGLFYNLIGVTGDNDPGPGNVALNNAVIDDVTEIYIDVLDANEGGRNVAAMVDLWTRGTVIILRSIASNAYAAFELDELPAAEAGYRRLAVSFVGSDGGLGNEPLAIEWRLRGTQGENFRIDARVTTPAGLVAWEGEEAGFRILVLDLGGIYAGRSGVVELEAGPNWPLIALYTGPRGLDSTVPGPFTEITFGPLTTLSPGTPGFVEEVPIGPGAVRLDFSLPRGTDGAGTVAGLVAGTGIAIDSSDPELPVISVTGGAATKLPEVAKTDNYAVVSADAGKMLAFNKATAVASTLPPVGASNEERYRFLNLGAGALTIDPNAAETVDGAVALVLPTGAAADIWPNAGKTAWRAFVYAPSDSYLAKAQNLADIPNKVAARAALSLKWETILDEVRTAVPSLDLINLGNYRRLRGKAFIRPSASTHISARMGNTNGASWFTGASDYHNSYLYGIVGNPYYQEDTSGAQIRVSITGAIGNGGQDGLELDFSVSRFNEGGAYSWLTYEGLAFTSTGNIAYGKGGGRCRQAVAFDALQLFPGAGNIAYSEIFLEGLR